MYLKACVNGVRTRAEHPAVPVTAGQVAADVAAVARAGADAVHLHVKDPSTGADTFDAGAVADVLRGARGLVPGVPIGVTTGAWAELAVEARLAAIARWSVLPDFASVNWHEAGAELVAAALLERGVAVEAGLWHLEAVRAWRASTLGARCVRVLLELPDGLDEAATVAKAERMLWACQPALTSGVTVVLHGEGSSCWPALRHALRRGVGARIGLEDTLLLPDGSPARDNAQLVRTARDLGVGAPGR